MSDEASKPSSDEQSKRKVAKKVISQKRQYFVPSARNAAVEAESAEEAVKAATKLDAAQEVGDV